MKKSHLLAFSSAFGIMIASFVMTAMLWSTLPSRIPVHFNFAGNPDAWATKNIFYVFMVPAIQLMILLLFVMIYRYPQYSSWPTTLILVTVEEKKREKIYSVLRSMLISILALISVLFAYLQFIILATANGRVVGLSSYVMIGFVAALIAYIIYFNARMFLTVNKLVKK